MRNTVLSLMFMPMLATASPAFAPPAETTTTEQAPVPLEEIQRYVAVYRTIQQAYVEPLSDKALMKASLRGLLTDLDPHSAYLQKDEAARVNEQASGSYVGIGVEIEQRPDRSLVVVAALDGTPAARAGLHAGDVILAIDGRPIAAEHADAASQQLRAGAAGSRVSLSVLPAGEQSPRELVLVRELIRVTSVSSRLLAPGYGYMRISQFQADTGPQVTRQLRELAATAPALRGVVLDLRSNPGGLLNAAVEAADAFLDQGVIVSTRGRLAYSNADYRAKAGDASGGAALVVLVDGGTASAAEVLAGALRDHARGLIMGSRTYGKGSVQTVLPLDNGDSVKLTTARYYTPSGKSIQARGIKPDQVLRGKAARGLREQDLAGHLAGSGSGSDDGFANGEVLEGDAAIQQALAQLQAMVAARS